jgi:hypothetical protein
LANRCKGRLSSLWATEFELNLEQRPKKQIWLK